MIINNDESETRPDTVRAFKLVSGQNLIGVVAPKHTIEDESVPTYAAICNPDATTVVDPMTYDITPTEKGTLIILKAFVPAQKPRDSFTFLPQHIMGPIGSIPEDVVQYFYRNCGRKYLHIAKTMPPPPGHN